MKPEEILHLLARGDRRTTGASDQVAAMITRSPGLFAEVFRMMSHDDKGVAMRAADALEKASNKSPNLLEPHKSELITLAKITTQQEVQWHVAQMIERLELSSNEQKEAFSALESMFLSTPQPHRQSQHPASNGPHRRKQLLTPKQSNEFARQSTPIFYPLPPSTCQKAYKRN